MFRRPSDVRMRDPKGFYETQTVSNPEITSGSGQTAYYLGIVEKDKKEKENK